MINFAPIFIPLSIASVVVLVREETSKNLTNKPKRKKNNKKQQQQQATQDEKRKVHFTTTDFHNILEQRRCHSLIQKQILVIHCWWLDVQLISKKYNNALKNHNCSLPWEKKCLIYFPLFFTLTNPPHPPPPPLPSLPLCLMSNLGQIFVWF